MRRLEAKRAAGGAGGGCAPEVETALLSLTTGRRLGPSAAGVQERGGGAARRLEAKRAAGGAGGDRAPEMEAALLYLTTGEEAGTERRGR